jgi:hypothetical protein
MNWRSSSCIEADSPGACWTERPPERRGVWWICPHPFTGLFAPRNRPPTTPRTNRTRQQSQSFGEDISTSKRVRNLTLLVGASNRSTQLTGVIGAGKVSLILFCPILVPILTKYSSSISTALVQAVKRLFLTRGRSSRCRVITLLLRNLLTRVSLP